MSGGQLCSVHSFPLCYEGFATCGKTLGMVVEFIVYLHIFLSQKDNNSKLLIFFWWQIDSILLLIRHIQRNEHLIWTFKLPETLRPNKKIIAFPDKLIPRREYFENSYFPSSSCDFLLKFMCHIHKLPRTFTKTRSKHFFKKSLLRLINIQWTACV